MSRLDDMLDRYGEAVTRTKAAFILGVCDETVRRMIGDGRLATVCEGTRVDVRSIAQYLEAPAKADFEAKQRRQGRKWVV